MKYRLGSRESNGLHRIIALKDFSHIKTGQLGGYVASKANLSQFGDAWVYDNAWVSGDARVYGNIVLTAPMLMFHLERHAICVYDNLVAVGCELHTIDYWLNNYEQIGKKNNYSIEDIEVYGDLLRFINKHWDIK
jgi:hypothetical protein